MRMLVGLLLVDLVSFSGVVNAQEGTEAVPDRYTQMKQAVEYATKGDAYNAYCDKPSSMASDYLDRFFKEEGLTPQQKEALADVMEKEVRDFLAWLQKDQPSCEDLEFMMGRIEIMRKLRDVSYLLNGVDPATLPPDNIPELKDLLPSRSLDKALSVEQ